MSISLQPGLRNSGAASNLAGGQGGNRFDDALSSAQDRPVKQRSTKGPVNNGTSSGDNVGTGKGTGKGSGSNNNSGNIKSAGVRALINLPGSGSIGFQPKTTLGPKGADNIIANNKNDTFFPGSKERTFNGGGGTDTVILKDHTGKPSVKKNADGSVILRYEIFTGPNKKKNVEQKLVNIERIETKQGKIETKNIPKGRFTFVTKVNGFVSNAALDSINQRLK